MRGCSGEAGPTTRDARDDEHATDEPTTRPSGTASRGWPATLAIEIVIGIALAVVLHRGAWASSNAIHFVYGGY